MTNNILKRTFAGVLAVLTVAGTIPANVGAGGIFASTAIEASAEGATSVSTAEELKNAVEAGEAFQLEANITLTETLDVTKAVTINLNGYNITADGFRAFHVKSGTLTLTGYGTISSTGDIDASSSVIRVGDGKNADDATEVKAAAGLDIGSGVTITSDKCYGVTVFGSKTTETVDVYGKVNVTGTVSAISGNGNPWNSGTTINIYPDAVVSAANDVAIYHPQAGTLNITGGRIEGLGGIEAKAGTAAISIKGLDTSIIATAEETSHKANGNGTSTRGYAIAAVENAGYAGSPQINVSGGNIVGPVELVKDNAVADEKKGAISITGGTFSTDVSAYVAQGYEVYQSGNSYTVSTEAVASIGEVRYPSLQAAIDAAQAGDTIELKKDVELSKTIVITKDVTIDSKSVKYIKATDVRAFWVKSGKLTLAGMCKVSSNGDNLDPDSSVIRVGSNDVPAGSTAALDIASEGVTVSSDKCYGVTVFGNKTIETVDVYGAIFANGGRSAISGNGSTGYGDTTINIYSGANISSGTGDVAIYHPQAGTLNITGGSIKGKSAVEAKAGTVNISGAPKLIAYGAIKDPTNNKNGSSTSGYAVAAVENDAYTGSVKVNISGGEFSNYPVGILVDNEVPAEKKASVSITGGTFNTVLDAAYIADGYAQHKENYTVDSLKDAESFNVTAIDVNENKTVTKVYPDYFGVDTYTIPKAVYLDGMIFTSWAFFDESGKFIDDKAYEGDAQQIANQLVSSGKDFTVKLQYSPDGYGGYLTVEGGTITSSPRTFDGYPTSDYISRNDLVKVTADNAAAFSYWKMTINGVETIVSYNPTYSFYMPEGDTYGNVSLEAVSNKDIEPKGTGNIESVKRVAENKMAFVSVLNVPDGCKMLKAGLVARKTYALNGAELTAANAKYVKYTDTSRNNYKTYKYTWTLGTNDYSAEWTVRPYLEYKDKEGKVQTIYGEPVAKSLGQL